MELLELFPELSPTCNSCFCEQQSKYQPLHCIFSFCVNLTDQVLWLLDSLNCLEGNFSTNENSSEKSMETTVGAKCKCHDWFGKNHLNCENTQISVIQDQADHYEDEKTWKVIAPTIV